MSNTGNMIVLLMLTVLLTALQCSYGNWNVIGVVLVALTAGMFVGEFIRQKARGR